MKAHTALRTAMMAAALMAAGLAAGAQGAPGAGPGFGDHRPPMERLLGPGGEHGRWWNDPTVIGQLKLTEDQRKAMDDILQQHREQLIDLRAGVEKAEVSMTPLMDADQPNESAILAQIDRIAQARAELEKGNARFLLELRAKLTPDQWKQLQAIRSQHRAGMENRQWREHGRHQAPAPPDGQSAPNPNPPPPGPGEPQAMLNQPFAPDHPAPQPPPAQEGTIP